MQSVSESDIKILLVDDHPIVAAGLKLVLKQRPGFTLLDSISTPQVALNVARQTPPDVLIVDLAFNEKVHIPFIAACRNLLPDALIMVFSSLPARSYKQAALAAGAEAYVGKEQDLCTLLDTVEEFMDKRRAKRRSVSSVEATLPLSAQSLPLGVHMTGRELEIAQLLSTGSSTARIAQHLGISIKTAAVHRDNLKKKLGCRDSTELIARLAKYFGDDQ